MDIRNIGSTRYNRETIVKWSTASRQTITFRQVLPDGEGRAGPETWGISIGEDSTSELQSGWV